MIKSLELQNFQGHEKSTLEFDKGVNVIIGSSDTGKSSVIRALRWVVFNKPRGDGFRSHWGGITSAKVITEDLSIIREKDKENVYRIEQDGKSSEYKALKTEVPEEVENALQLSELNIQNQQDSSFLLSNTPGEVAQHFNRIAGLDQIDTGLKNIQSDIRKIEQDIKYKQDSLTQMQEEIKGYNYIEDAQKEIIELEQKEQTLEKTKTDKETLQKIIQNLKDTEKRINDLQIYADTNVLIEDGLKYIEKRKQLTSQKNALKKQIDDVNGVEYEIERLRPKIQTEELIQEGLKLISKQKKQTERSQKLNGLIKNIEVTTNNSKEIQEKLDKLETKYHEEFPSICPLCGQNTK